MKKNLIFLTLILITLVSCAKPTVVNVVMPNDTKLNCIELSDEFFETRRFKKEAQNLCPQFSLATILYQLIKANKSSFKPALKTPKKNLLNSKVNHSSYIVVKLGSIVL